MTNPKWQERINQTYDKYIEEPAPKDDPHHKLNEELRIQFIDLQDRLIKFGFHRGYECAITDILKDVEGLVEALKFECGNRCAEQNPCNAKEALKLWDEKGYGK